ncbi:MAG TPA: glycosyltransferase, partial [Nannocystaceae bacterium]|nr:glycosyltransferase [Nannocystaceae bacterium]
LGRIADAVILMAYDQHHENGAPGPIATRSWLRARIDEARAVVDPTRLVVALGSYCYDWPATGAATSRTVPDAFALAADVGATPITVADTGNLRFDYADPQGTPHQVWCLDATAGADALALLDARGISRTALWRAGSEDPSWWNVIAAPDRAGRARALQQIPAGATKTEGTGDVVARTARARAGTREVELDADGAVVHARVDPPSPEVLTRMGGHDDGVVLTFDDGPHPTWTPAILDVLAEHGASATFFAIGEAAQTHPDLVRRTVAEGHLVGNHTWDHEAFAQQSPAQIAAQLERTSSLLQALVGHEIRFVRAPYLGMLAPDDADGWSAIAPALAADYAYVRGSVDAGDWDETDADAIVARVLAQVDAGGRVVVMHDGGGDRSATVAALRTLIPELRRRGHDIVGLEAAIGRTRAEIAPPLPSASRVAALAHGAATDLRALAAALLPWLFALCTALAAARIVALTVLVLRRAPSPRPRSDRDAPLVTVLLPAYNEGKVIAATLASLREGDHQALDIIVIDDGSTDDTSAVVARIAAIDPRVRCLRKANGGRASAANLGLARARGEIVVAVDADTQIAKDAIARMVAHFEDPRVTAVCGNVEVGNVRSIWTAFQAIEYVTSQNFDRRAFAAVDAIGVVPGALGAWRRDAVLAVGGYSHDTLVEDADLTLAVLRGGGKITYEPRAIARTEAPETLSALWKQRFRWTYGTFQCLAKHRAALGRGAPGRITLPNALVFQVLFPLVSPIGDLALVAAIATGAWSAVLSGYLGFLAMDLLASVLAFRLDRKPMRWLPLLLVQRFTYRQFLYFVSLRAMFAVLSGSRHGWRKLERTATVIALPTASEVALDRAA